MHLLGSLDDLSVEELIEQTNDEDKYLVETFLKKLEELVDRYIDIRREELGDPELKYSLETIRVDGNSLTVKYSKWGGCSCSSNCGYEYTEYDIGMFYLFLPEEEIRKLFSAEKERQEKEQAEKMLLEQLKKKYEESR